MNRPTYFWPVLLAWILSAIINGTFGYFIGKADATKPAQTVNIVTFRMEPKPVPVIQIPQ